MRFLLTDLVKNNNLQSATKTPQFLFLKDNVGTLTKTEETKTFVTFAQSLSAFSALDSTPAFELEAIFTQLDLNNFERFALASLLLVSAKQQIADQGTVADYALQLN